MHDSVDAIEMVAPGRITATANGAAVNVRDYVGKGKLTLATGAGGGTTPTYDAKVQESADGSTGWTDVSGAAFTQVTGAADATESIGLDFNAMKAFLRIVETITGTNPTFDRSITLTARKQVI